MTHLVQPFNVEAISRRPAAPICVTDRPDCVEAIATLLPGHAVIAVPAPNGVDAVVNWVIAVGGDVLIWPSRDYPVKARQALSHALKAVRARRVTTLKLSQDTPDDALDAVAQGWDEASCAAWLQTQGIGEPHCAELPDDQPEPSEIMAIAGDRKSNVECWIDWGLKLNEKGAPLNTMSNAARVLEHDPKLQGCVWFDEFLQRLLTGDPPKEWSDKHVVTLQRYFQETIGISRMSIDAVKAAVTNIAFLNTRNEVRDWLDTLEWDGIERIAHFFPDHFGTVDGAYSQSVSRNFWISMMARAYKPGCKVDNMVILEGKQGAQKSSALNLIGGRWYAEQAMSVRDPQKFAENIQGKLIMEIAEMDSFHGAEMTRVKQTVSCASDRYRDSYGHYARDHPRQGIFCGTTNADDWNRDPTGARRFWPITCLGQINLACIANVREQCFAEAVAAFKANEKWWLMPEDETEREQRDRFYEDPWDVRIDNIVATLEDVATSEVLSFIGIPPEKQTKADQMRIARRLTFLKWERKNTRDGNRVLKRYYNPDK